MGVGRRSECTDQVEKEEEKEEERRHNVMQFLVMFPLSRFTSIPEIDTYVSVYRSVSMYLWLCLSPYSSPSCLISSDRNNDNVMSRVTFISMAHCFGPRCPSTSVYLSARLTN